MLAGNETLSKLLGILYDAAADPPLWDVFLQQLAHSTGARCAGLVLRDADKDVYTISHSWGFDAEFLRLYEEHYASEDVWARRGSALPAGSVCTS